MLRRCCGACLRPRRRAPARPARRAAPRPASPRPRRPGRSASSRPRPFPRARGRGSPRAPTARSPARPRRPWRRARFGRRVAILGDERAQASNAAAERRIAPTLCGSVTWSSTTSGRAGRRRARRRGTGRRAASHSSTSPWCGASRATSRARSAASAYSTGNRRAVRRRARRCLRGSPTACGGCASGFLQRGLDRMAAPQPHRPGARAAAAAPALHPPGASAQCATLCHCSSFRGRLVNSVVDRAGFEPAYACTGRFTVCLASDDFRLFRSVRVTFYVPSALRLAARLSELAGQLSIYLRERP